MTIATNTLLAGRYRADELLGRGGMGEVWRCHDLEQDMDVAIKAVHTKHLNDPQIARLFYDEVIAVARLNHPGIVPVYDFLRELDGTAFLVMAYRSGQPLASFVSRTPPWIFISAVLTRMLEALAYAHARGILHLDVKPENVIVDRSDSALLVTLVDFGLARRRRAGRGVRRWMERDVVVGTIGYMAPEQCDGSIERFGPWTDLYSVGTIAFELCTGQRPFPDDASLPALIRRMGSRAPPLIPRVDGVPDGFAELCARLLAIQPRDRPPQAADVLCALRELAPPSLRSSAASEPSSQPTKPPRSAVPVTLRSAPPPADGEFAPKTERDPVITSFDLDRDSAVPDAADREATLAFVESVGPDFGPDFGPGLGLELLRAPDPATVVTSAPDSMASESWPVRATSTGPPTALTGAPLTSAPREIVETIIQEASSEPIAAPTRPMSARISSGPWRVAEVEKAFNADASI